jgi:hypothetical protein
MKLIALCVPRETSKTSLRDIHGNRKSEADFEDLNAAFKTVIRILKLQSMLKYWPRS